MYGVFFLILINSCKLITQNKEKTEINPITYLRGTFLINKRTPPKGKIFKNESPAKIRKDNLPCSLMIKKETRVNPAKIIESIFPRSTSSITGGEQTMTEKKTELNIKLPLLVAIRAQNKMEVAVSRNMRVPKRKVFESSKLNNRNRNNQIEG